MKKKKKVFLIILGAFLLIIAGFLVFLSTGLNLKNAAIKNVDISSIPDGTYTGEISGNRFGNKLEATVSGGRIVDIRIVNDMAIAVPDVSSKIFAKVLESQSLQIDSVSGATVTSKAYLKSLENALDLN